MVSQAVLRTWVTMFGQRHWVPAFAGTTHLRSHGIGIRWYWIQHSSMQSHKAFSSSCTIIASTMMNERILGHFHESAELKIQAADALAQPIAQAVELMF